MTKPLNHTPFRMTICTGCKIRGGFCSAGYEMLKRLQAGISAAGTSLGPEFEISGQVTLSGCPETCTAAYYGSQAGCYLFGDVAEGQDIAELLAYAKTGSSGHLAHEPACVVALEPVSGSLH